MSKSPNHFNGRSGWYVDTICNHITEGSFAGAVTWLCNPNSGVSAHVVIGREGQIEKLVDYKDGSWANGTTVDGSQKSTLSYVRERRTNANLYTLSIEFEGWHNSTDGELTEPQYQSALNIYKEMIDWMKSTYNVDFDIDNHIIGHNMISPTNKPYCPGSKFPYSRLKSDLHAWKGSNPQPAPEPQPTPSTGLAKGDIVIVKDSATHFVTGQRIASVAKNRRSVVSSVNGNKILVAYNGAAVGWFYDWDLEKQSSNNPQPSNPQTIIDGVTSVTINSGAYFTNGARVAGFATNRPSIVKQHNNSSILVEYQGGIVGWVNIKYTSLANSINPPTNSYKVIAGAGLNLRASHSTNAARVGGIPYGATFNVVETFNGNNYFWGRTTYNGVSGWCALELKGRETYASKQ